MLALLTLKDISLALGGPHLMAGVDLRIEKGERICLIGRNGEGKTTLLRLMGGELSPDSGEMIRLPGMRVATLPQSVPADRSGSALDVAREPGPDVAPDGDAPAEHVATRTLTMLGMDPTADFSSLSTGGRRRVLLAGALAREPDLLLLDEPTNHLDIAAISWLEDHLARSHSTMMFVTHDRAMVRRLATRILELDRGRLFDWPSDYDTFVKRRDEALEAEASANAEFDKRLAREEVWIRRGVRERRTRNEGRVRRLQEMREIHGSRRNVPGRVRMKAEESGRSGKRVIEARGVDFAWGDNRIIRDLDIDVMRGDRVGIIGPNGSGKTTLLRLLLGEIVPDHGEIKLGTGLREAYFDQRREVLDENATVRENVADGADTMHLGSGDRHVMSYLQDFLFTPDRAHAPITALSGGERNRLLLARIFAKPSNLMVLDEPTNDLDIETLELLEELLLDYNGTVLVVSHDRAFLDNVVTSTLALEGDGRVVEYAGGHSDWERVRAAAASGREPRRREGGGGRKRPDRRPKDLTWKEERELETLPGRIEDLELELSGLQQELSDPELYRKEGSFVAARKAELAAKEADLASTYARWEELESKRDLLRE